MIKSLKIKNKFSNWNKLSPLKVVKNALLSIGVVILICVLIFIFFSDPIINTFLKGPIKKAFTEAYPAYSIKFSDLHYNFWKNRFGCDSLSLKNDDSSFTCRIGSFSINGISWMKILLQRDFITNNLTSSEIDAQKIIIKFLKSQKELRFGLIHISVPDSEMTADSVKYYPLTGDEQFFEKSQFRQTGFRFDIPQIKIMGMNFLEMLQGKIYNARSINIYGLFADILVNMDKPYNVKSANPQMPNEFLSSLKEIIKIDSVKIIDGRLKYCERFALKTKPGVITFSKVNVSICGIANHTTKPNTAVVNGEGLFMNSSKMKLFMAIPITSKDFSLRYSGSLETLDVTKLNSFIEPSEHQRIKSGILQSAVYQINVNSGYASGTLHVMYKDLTIAVLNKETGSENGIFNQISSFFGKIFIIRRTNMPDEKGLMKIGEIKYTRNPQDYFLQYLWFALRGSIADVVGFPRE